MSTTYANWLRLSSQKNNSVFISTSIAWCNDNDTLEACERDANIREATMTLEKACDILGYDYSRPIEQLQQLAAIRKTVLAKNAPLRFKVAISVILGK